MRKVGILLLSFVLGIYSQSLYYKSYKQAKVNQNIDKNRKDILPISLTITPKYCIEDISDTSDILDSSLIRINLNEGYKIKAPNKDKYSSIEFNCIIKNNSNEELIIVDPEAYKISPHPYTIKVNGVEANLWSGDFMCAPSFKQSDKIHLKPKESIERTISWNIFVNNYSIKPSTYRFAVKYKVIKSKIFTMGAKADDINDIDSCWSNETTITLF